MNSRRFTASASRASDRKDSTPQQRLLRCRISIRPVPGSDSAAALVKRKGRLFFKGKNGFEILCERLCAVKTQWARFVEHADLTDEEKWLIFNLLMRGDARIEEVPGLGLKVTLPPRRRH
jgi:hypothetical protein